MNKIFFCLIVLVSTFSCKKIDRDENVDKNKLLGADYRLFQGTPTWNLAKAVWDDDTEEIEKEISKNPKLLNYQEPIFGNTLLNLSIYNDNYKSFVKLLQLGANPNITDFKHCGSPLITACEDFEDKTKYAKELIKFGANVNYVECNKGKEEQKTNRTPLIYSCIRGNRELVELLIANGASVNFVNTNSEYALSAAALAKHYDLVLYLLKHGADCSNILYKKYNADNSETPVYFKDWVKNEDTKSSSEYSEIMVILKNKGCL